MPDMVNIVVNGQPVSVPSGTTVAVALLIGGVTHFRTSVAGEPRSPVCGMGTCIECRLTIDGLPHSRSCQIQCAEAMEVVTS